MEMAREPKGERSRRKARQMMDDRFLRAFAAVAKGVSRSLSLEMVLGIALEAAMQDPRVEAAEIYLLDEESGELTYACQRGLSEECVAEAEQTPTRAGEGITGRVASLGEPIFVPELAAEEWFLRQMPKKEGYCSLYSVPIKSAEKVCAVWNLYLKTPRVSSRYLDWLATSAELLGVAFEYAHVLEEARDRARELETSEDKYRHLVEDINEGYMVLRGLRVVFANDRCSEYIGIPPDKMVGGPFTEFVSPEALEQAMELYRTSIGGGALPEQVELMLTRADGSEFPVEIRFKEITFEGKPAVALLIRDITERKRAEEALRESEEKYRELFETTLDGMAVIDAETMRIVLANQATLKMYGFDSVEDIVGVNPLDYIPPEDRDRAIKIMAQDMFESDLRQVNEFRTITKDGREIWLSAVGVRTEYQGKLAGLISFRDITERKRAEEALRQSEERLRALIENAPDGIHVHDLDATFLDANRKAEELVGYSREELLGKSFLEVGLLPEEYLAEAAALLEKSRRGEPTGPDELELIRKDGSRVAVELSSIPVRRGDRVEVITITRDITERKRAEEEILKHTRWLEAHQAVAATVSQTLDLDELLDSSLSQVLEVMDMDVGGIYLIDTEARELVLKAHRGISQEVAHELGRIKAEEEEFERGMEWRETVFDLEKVFSEANLARLTAAMEKEGVQSHTIVGLWSKGVLLGALVVASRSERQLTPEDMDLLSAIGNQIAVAIENASLYQDTKGKAKRLAVTAELTHTIVSSLNIEDVYQAFAAGVRRLVDFDRASIALVEGDRLRFLAVSSEVETELGAGVSVPLQDTATAWVVAHKKTNIETDFAKMRQFAVDEAHLRSGLRSAIRLPLFSRGEVIGTFNLSSRRPHAYGDREQEILEEMAGQIAVAIENDRLFAEVRQRKEDLEAAYSQLLLSSQALEQSKRELEDSYMKMARTLALTLEARDPYSRGHSERVAQIARQLAFEMGLPQEEIKNLETAGRLHDLGKIGIPDGILLKPDGITPSERAEIQLHPTKAVDLLRFLGFLNGTLPMIEHHHERYDGGGYPSSLKGEEIPLGARILAVADAYDAMTSARPYRAAMTSEQAINILKDGAGIQWDAKVVDAFLRAFGNKGEGKNAR